MVFSISAVVGLSASEFSVRKNSKFSCSASVGFAAFKVFRCQSPVDDEVSEFGSDDLS
jgi:hypothetical protein